MHLSKQILPLLSLTAFVAAGPCPFKMMKEAGLLKGRDFEKLARNPEWIPALEHAKRDDAHMDKREAEPESEPEPEAEAEAEEKRAVLPGGTGGILGLPLGGGLTSSGGLAKLTGILSGLAVPTPQPFGLAPINGDLPGHQFIYPSKTDVRGLCPTLNTLANHGFLSRNGITSFAEAGNAVQTAYGFAYDLSTFLSGLGLLAGGDLVSGKYSIGGADSRVPNTLGPALGLDKHGTFEIDGSITRQDNYFGNQATFQLKRWNRFLADANANGAQFGLPAQIRNQRETYTESRNTNPEFFAGAKYFAVSTAERIFIFEGLPNGTHQKDANFNNIAPFFLNETFPDDWFRRGTPFTLANAATDILQLYAGFPFQLGGNYGKAGNFVPSGTSIPSSPSALMCLALKSVFDTIPGQAQPTLLNNLATYMGFVDGAMAPLVTNAAGGCPGLKNYTVPSGGANNPAGSTSAPGTPINGVYPATNPGPGYRPDPPEGM